MDTCDKVGYRGVLSQSIFPIKWQLPNCTVSQAATSQVCPSRSHRPPSVIAAALGPIAHPSSSTWPLLQPAAYQRPYLTLGSCHLENAWEVTTWENAFGKVPITVVDTGKMTIKMKIYLIS